VLSLFLLSINCFPAGLVRAALFSLSASLAALHCGSLQATSTTVVGSVSEFVLGCDVDFSNVNNEECPESLEV
jgi:hypothetical protein